jgi:hypothetical protein
MFSTIGSALHAAARLKFSNINSRLGVTCGCLRMPAHAPGRAAGCVRRAGRNCHEIKASMFSTIGSALHAAA